MKITHQNIFFTSDWHLFHDNVLIYDKRPFKDVYEMHETLVKNWNNKVPSDAVVFYMGDLSFAKNIKLTIPIVEQLNGQIHFIMGNHDRYEDIKKIGRFENIYDLINLRVTDIDAPKNEQSIVLSHYPILSWNKINRGSYHLHGHEHMHLAREKEWEWYYKLKVLDMGCNGWDYTPVSYQEVKEIMKTKETKQIHH